MIMAPVQLRSSLASAGSRRTSGDRCYVIAPCSRASGQDADLPLVTAVCE